MESSKEIVIKFKILLLCFLSTTLFATTAKDVIAYKKHGLTIGIISAVPGESGQLLELIDNPVSYEKGKRTYNRGRLYGIDTVLVASRIGKVAASATATHLIIDHKVDLIIFTGVAGAIDASLNVGDIVIANALIQHDMDGRPFCPLYELPLLKIVECYTDPLLKQIATHASEQFMQKEFLEAIPPAIRYEFHLNQPKVVQGLVVTGDQVISQESQKIELKRNLPEALCVEMEGASVAQVCYEYDIPYVVIRTISDYANHEKIPIDVKKFVTQVSGLYSLGIIKNIYMLIDEHIEHNIFLECTKSTQNEMK